MINIFDAVMFSVLGLWILAASLFDIKRREVPDWLNFSLIFAGLGLRGIYSLITWDYWYIVYGIIGFVLAFIIGLAMSYGRQWGDGDSKMLLGIGACLGFSFGFSLLKLNSWPLFLSFFINSMIAGAIYGLIYAIVLSVIHWKEFKKEFVKFDKRVFVLPLVVFIVLAVICFALLDEVFMSIGISLALVIVVGVYIIIFMRIVQASCMIKNTDVYSLVPGDWVVGEVRIKGKVICSSKDRCLNEEQIKMLKRYKVRKVMIKNGIPFVPSFFFGLIITLIWGNLLGLLV